MKGIGRKKSVLVRLGVSLLCLVVGMFGERYGLMVWWLCLLGIGNGLMES